MKDYPLGHCSLAICKCRKTNVQISKFELRNILASYSYLNQDYANIDHPALYHSMISLENVNEVIPPHVSSTST
ncbi:hypothetical protein pdam_00024732 [Pocillopora damicornis]|uniref:Uncharacterized protein n=1 Tax=Pocillopora damicornis TaxID=46731 RepID=A0A3M6U4N7_POCDA|nr:hypothetical protein pdam_00024732 [Pocillopora damicornis]